MPNTVLVLPVPVAIAKRQVFAPKITACSASGQEMTVFAQPSSELEFYISEGVIYP